MKISPTWASAFWMRLVAAIASALVLGWADGFGRPTWIERAAAAGFTALCAVPIAFAVITCGSVLAKAWRLPDLIESNREPDTGGVPRLAAWLSFLLLAAIVLASAVLQGMNLVTKTSGARVVYALTAPIFAVAFALALAALSRPSVDVLAWLWRAVDRRLFGWRGRTWMTAPVIAAFFSVLATGLAFASWTLIIRPKVGHIDLSYGPELLFAVATMALVPVGLRLCSAKLRTLAAVVLCSVTAFAVSASLWVRTQRPYTMLEIWGETQVAGFAVDALFDIETLRGELHVEGIEPEAKPGATHPDVILITIDTLRADRTPPYGGKARMPALAKLAGRGTVFEWAISPGNVTRRSLPSIAMGVSAPRLRGRVKGWALKLDPRHVTVAERFRAAGYDTAGFFCCNSQFGARHRLGLIRGINEVFVEKEGERLASQAATWLEKRKHNHGDGNPAFIWLHFIEPHGWQKSHPSTPDTRKDTQRYDLSLADVDKALVVLVDAIEARDPKLANTLVALTSDHGEGLGDHDIRTHSVSLYNAEIRVPLILSGNGLGVRRIQRPVGLYDLAPTLLDLAGYVPPGMPAMDGISWAPILEGVASSEMEAGEAYSAMIPDRSVSTEQRALIRGNFKIIVKGKRVELFDIANDPKEKRDLSSNRPEIRKQMLQRLEERRRIDELAAFE